MEIQNSAEKQLESSFKEISDLKYALDEHAIVAITTPQGTITYVNDKFCAISQYSKEELVGQDHRVINSGYHSTEFFRDLWTTISNGRVWKGEVKNKAKNGAFYWVDTTIVPFLQENGKPHHYIAIRADITERKLAEEKLTASLKEIGDLKYALDEHAIVAITDPKGKIIYVNDKFCGISKYSRDELIGQDHRIINSGLHSKEFFRDLWNTISHGRVWKGEVKNKAKDGTFYWVDTTIVPFLNENGKPHHYVAIRADITERKEAEERLTDSLREKEALLREIHHRVKNNMQVISSILQLQTNYIQNAAALEVFKDCQGRIRTMALIHEKLYRSKGLTQIDFKDYLESLTGLLLRSHTGRGIAVRCDLQIAAVTFDVDTAIPLGLIANEMISNCFKHAFAGRASGLVRVSLQAQESGQLCLMVKDDGNGLPPDFSLEKVNSLGVKLVMMLSKQIRGKVTFSSNNGTEFAVTFNRPPT